MRNPNCRACKHAIELHLPIEEDKYNCRKKGIKCESPRCHCGNLAIDQGIELVAKQEKYSSWSGKKPKLKRIQ